MNFRGFSLWYRFAGKSPPRFSLLRRILDFGKVAPEISGAHTLYYTKGGIKREVAVPQAGPTQKNLTSLSLNSGLGSSGSSDFWILSETAVRNWLSGGGLGNRPLSFYTPLFIII